MMRLLLFSIIILFMVNCSAQKGLEMVEGLQGTWQMENKNTFEVWSKDGMTLTGMSYKLVDEEKKIMETLKITREADKVIYHALVPNQNDGASIPFVLKILEDGTMSFENLEHDFPQKIQYKSIADYKMLVNVLGPDGKGFSYHLIKKN